MGVFKDHTGKKYGMLTVIRRVANRNGLVMWLCKCDCGKTKIARSSNLVSGDCISCGCIKDDFIKGQVGKRYGKLTVVRRTANDKNGRTMWECKCDCGKTKIVKGKYLMNGETQSCGCLRSEVLISRNYKHGLSDHDYYQTWCGIKNRCYNKNEKSYKSYGGRGIEVCDRWLNSFENFLKDMGQKPAPNMSIDRIDVNGNYEPSNCRWANSQQQGENQRKVRKIKNSLGQIFASQTRASLDTGIKRTSISGCLRGRIKSAGKDKNGNPIKWFYA